MQSATTRIAYLKRMLLRLKGEEERLQNLVSAGELTAEGAKLGAEQLAKDRAKLSEELRGFEQEPPHAESQREQVS